MAVTGTRRHSTGSRRRPARGLTPVVAVVLLAAVTVLAAGAVGAALPAAPGQPPPTARLSLSADAAADRLTFIHRGGDAIDPDTLRLRVRIGGQPLDHQPPVPFFAARGFRAGPHGPFNAATSGTWRAGQSASLRLAATNAPTIDPGDRVRVTVYAEDARLADLTATAT
jgi:FlaG/FlaF family flagellin (archaellin)